MTPRGAWPALRSSLDALPTYAPAILSLGSVEYQLERPAEGRRLFLSLLELPDDGDLAEIIDRAGDFLISIAAAEAAIALEPDNQEFVNDLGWSLYLAGRLEEGRATLARAAAMNPADPLAAENLRVCEGALEACAA